MKQLKKTILTLVALIAVTTGAWAETGENIFQYCYDCQRNPAYPKTTASASLSGFANPLVGYKGSGFGMGNTPAGPWKLEYVGLWSTTNQYGIGDIWNYQDTYKCTDVPVFRLYQWNATANEYQHAAYGVVCAYAKVSNAVEHTAFFEAEGGWGCVLTNSSHSSSMNITFDEDLTTGLTTLIAAATPNASSGTAVDVAWDNAKKTGTFTMPGGNVTVSVEYYDLATLADKGLTAAEDAAAKTEAPLAVLAENAVTGGTLMYYVTVDENFTQANAIALPDDKWDAAIPTAEELNPAGGTYYVWYYIKGDDEHSDTDPQRLAVTVLPEPTYKVEFAEGTDPNEWTATPNTGLTKGETVTVTYTGTKKVLGVKAEKKAAAASLIVNPVVGQIIGSDGKNYDANATLPDGVTAVAKICYVGSDNGEDAPYNHGLALAMSNAGNGGNFNICWSISTITDNTEHPNQSSSFPIESGLQYNDAKHDSNDFPAFKAAMANNGTAAPTGCSAWFLASGYQWTKMFAGAGSAGNLKSLAGLENTWYWTSSEINGQKAWQYSFNKGKWWETVKSDSQSRVRSCLAF